MQKSIIIIGAGITGLSAGCYAQMNGYRTQIFELGALPGGLCTSWKRNDYTIDGCIHWLVGSSPANYFYRFWEELGAVQGRRMINHEEFARIEGEGGKTVIFYANIHRLEQHLKELAPEDVGVIDEFIKAVRSCTGVNMPIEKAPELYSPTEGLRMLFRIFPHAGFIQKWKKTSTRAFSERIKNTLLREAYRASFGDLPDFPMLGMIMTFAWLHQNTAGYPVGGSLEFSRAIERRYLDLGGDIHYRSPVAKILVKNDMAVGIRLFDGTEHHGDIVVSAADGHTTIFNMLGGQYIDSKIQGHYDNLPIFPPLLYIALGVNRTFNEVPHSVSGTSYLLDKPLTIAGHDHKRLPVHIYNFDPTLAPEGKTVLKVMLGSDYDYWKSLNRDSER